ncbi:MAG: hypothetical protein FJ363_10895 [Gemmatimonadetes bacterium]|nr:hypothetical protein [Gemmatimonadota bacterium]
MTPRFRLSPLRRLLLVLLAVVQVGSPVLATVAHAQMARATTEDVARVHVEEPGERHAPPGHPESCVVCQMLARTLAVPAEPTALCSLHVLETVEPTRSEQLAARAPTARIRTRAPPTSV